MVERELADSSQFQFKKYDFVETSLMQEPHEDYTDLVENKIFKFKYRRCNDNEDTYSRRQGRLMARFAERARTRD
jgi:hypothetical protein